MKRTCNSCAYFRSQMPGDELLKGDAMIGACMVHPPVTHLKPDGTAPSFLPMTRADSVCSLHKWMPGLGLRQKLGR